MWTHPLVAYSLSLHGLAVMIGLLVYVLASHTLQQRRQARDLRAQPRQNRCRRVHGAALGRA